MRLFKNLFSGNFNNEFFNSEEDQNDNWADSITTGWEYTCNLFLYTPKICLQNDGLISEGIKKPELFGEPNKFGADGEPFGRYGSWTRRMGHEEEFDQFKNISEDMVYARSSDIGKIPHKSQLEKDFRSFLIDFRNIVESYIDIEEKFSLINNELSIKSEIYSEIYKKLVIEQNFPDNFFINELTILNGVTKEISFTLWDAGYISPQYVLDAPNEELLMLEGIDENIIRKIKS